MRVRLFFGTVVLCLCTALLLTVVWFDLAAAERDSARLDHIRQLSLQLSSLNRADQQWWSALALALREGPSGDATEQFATLDAAQQRRAEAVARLTAQAEAAGERDLTTVARTLEHAITQTDGTGAVEVARWSVELDGGGPPPRSACWGKLEVAEPVERRGRGPPSCRSLP